MGSDDLDKLARGLTDAQRRALLHNNAGGTAFSWASLSTLEALHKRDFVRQKIGPGAFYSPQTAIEWPLTPLGLALRAHIERNEG